MTDADRFGTENLPGWEGWPVDRRRGRVVRPDRDTAPERTDGGHLVLYHATGPEAARSITASGSLRPDGLGCVGVGTTPAAVRVYGLRHAGPDAVVLRLVVDAGWLARQQVTREIGGSGRDQFLVHGPVPREALRGVGVAHEPGHDPPARAPSHGGPSL